jgi:peptidylprolyl isomerase
MTYRILALVAALALLTAFAVRPGGDYSILPVPPGEFFNEIAAKAPLARAVEAAEKDVGGRARTAGFTPNGDVRVEVFTASQHYVVEVDGASATVKAKEEKKTPELPGDPVQGKLVRLPSGLMYYDLVVGTGAQPEGPTSTVKVHYTGWLNNGQKFDSSRDTGAPAQFRLNQVIQGWIEGVGSMRAGGKRKLIIPHELAYKQAGRPGIPPLATLVFDIELLEVVK